MPDTATLPVKAPLAGYVMPEVFLGEIVLHYRDKSSAPAVGIVVKLGARSIGLSLVTESRKDLQPIDGVRHKSDPVWQTMRQDDGGWWDYTEQGRILRRLLPLSE